MAMRQGEVLAEDKAETYRPLGAFGQPVHLSYTQLRAAVAQKLSPRAANLFAAPQTDARGNTIRWVSPVPGTPERWDALPPEKQAAYALDLQILRAEFDAFLAELDAAGSAHGGEAFASVLRQALKTPNDGHLHFIGDQPVMTFWGFSELDGAAFEPLAAPAPAEPPSQTAATAPPPPIVEDKPRRFPPWLLWLLPLLLLLLLLFLLWHFFWRDDRPVDPPNVLIPPVEAPVPETAPDERPPVVDENGRIIERNGVTVDVPGTDGIVEGDGVAPGALEDGGTPDAPPLPGEVPLDAPGEAPLDAPGEGPIDAPGEDPAVPELPGPETPPETDQNPQDQSEPSPTEETEPPTPDETQDQTQNQDRPQPDQQPGDALELPPPEPPSADAPGDAAGPGSLRFLGGRWKTDTPLVDENNRKLDHRYEFGEDGKGKSIVRRQDGVECVADAEAVMQDGQLRITEKSGPRCPDGQEFEKSDTTCAVGDDGKTRCRGDGYNADIRRAPN